VILGSLGAYCEATPPNNTIHSHLLRVTLLALYSNISSKVMALGRGSEGRGFNPCLELQAIYDPNSNSQCNFSNWFCKNSKKLSRRAFFAKGKMPNPQASKVSWSTAQRNKQMHLKKCFFFVIKQTNVL